MLHSTDDQPSGAQGSKRELLRAMLADLLLRLDVPNESSAVSQALNDALVEDDRSVDSTALSIMRAGTAVGLRICPLELNAKDVWELLLDDFPVAVLYETPTGRACAAIFSNVSGGKVDATLLSDKNQQTDSLTRRQVTKLLSEGRSQQFFIAEPALSCERISTDHEHHQA
ncbi:MAG: hypothetical protein WCP62_02520, partial [Planctomycetota bacterium]